MLPYDAKKKEEERKEERKKKADVIKLCLQMEKSL